MGECSQQLRGLAGAHPGRYTLFVFLYFDGTAAIIPSRDNPCPSTPSPWERDLSLFQNTSLDFPFFPVRVESVWIKAPSLSPRPLCQPRHTPWCFCPGAQERPWLSVIHGEGWSKIEPRSGGVHGALGYPICGAQPSK